MYSGLLTGVVLAFGAAVAGFIGIMVPTFRRYLSALYQAEGQRQSDLVETIHGMRAVKSLALEAFRIKAWDQKVANSIRRRATVGYFSAIAVVVQPGLAGLENAGPHGFSEILYAYVSGTGNNGSAFAGLTANSLFYNTTIGLAMLIGRFAMIVPMLAVAGSLAAKKIVPPSAGTFPTTGSLWVGLLVGVILIVGGLTFFPALALGPIVEHLAMDAGTLF